MKNGLAKKLLLKTLRGVRDCSIEIVCAEGTYQFGDANHELRATVAVHNEDFFARALFGGDIGVGESFMDGDWSSPDVVSVVRAATRNMIRLDESSKFVGAFSRVADWIKHRRNDNTIDGSRKNIAYHYDLGNEFYKLFLDESLAYSCAIHERADDSLDAAQMRKFETICRKLDLNSQDHLLEIGTGWGGFAAYAARTRGCRITTTTISRQQHDYAAEVFKRLAEESGEDRIELLLEDYRKLKGQFDKIVSIEMFEAVGFKHYDDYFGACDRLLKPEGSMLLQSITMNEAHFDAYLRQSDFIKKYIFPGAELASVSGVLASLARTTGLQMAHLEDIGMHYAETLKAWRVRFLDRIEAVKALGFDERFNRMWEFYLAYCEGAFRERYIGDVQMLLTKTAVKRLFHEPMPEAVEEAAGHASELRVVRSTAVRR